MPVVSQIAPAGQCLAPQQVSEVIAQTCPAKEYRGKRVLLIVPDGTDGAGGALFQTLHRQLAEVTGAGRADCLGNAPTHERAGNMRAWKSRKVSDARPIGRCAFLIMPGTIRQRSGASA